MPNKLFQNKYRTQTFRLKNWDYTWPGPYHVTICTENHLQYFGKCKKAEMHLNIIRKIAQKYWKEIPKHHPVELDEFIIMPNHKRCWCRVVLGT